MGNGGLHPRGWEKGSGQEEDGCVTECSECKAIFMRRYALKTLALHSYLKSLEPIKTFSSGYHHHQEAGRIIPILQMRELHAGSPSCPQDSEPQTLQVLPLRLLASISRMGRESEEGNWEQIKSDKGQTPSLSPSTTHLAPRAPM